MGSHISQTCPSGNYFDCRVLSIGVHFNQPILTWRDMSELTRNELVKHGLCVLRETPCTTGPNCKEHFHWTCWLRLGVYDL